MKRLIAILGLLAALAAPAAAQQLPYDQSQTVGTSPVQVLAVNPARKQIFVHNPNSSATIAVCPTLGRKGTVTCAVNGAGSITLLPGGSVTLGGVGTPTAAIPTPWNGVGSGSNAAITIYEWE